ncbi:hypothetical protein ABT215_11175 [Streptomyces sp900105755]|uniref:hypothetical protein n=1 Tax=Streptomyces sp. 900105755 TaxID=3154389 RepID=UPI0033347309
MSTNAQIAADSNQIFEALTHGVAGDDDTAWDLLAPIAQRSNHAMYAVFCTIAEAAAFDAIQQQGAGNFVIEVEDVETGAEGSVDELPPGVRFATQFLTARANRDEDTAHALYLALHQNNPDELGIGLRALYEMAVVSLRSFIERKRAAEGRS